MQPRALSSVSRLMQLGFSKSVCQRSLEEHQGDLPSASAWFLDAWAKQRRKRSIGSRPIIVFPGLVMWRSVMKISLCVKFFIKIPDRNSYFVKTL